MSPKLATTSNVSLEQLLEFVRPRHHLVLITQRNNGSPQVSPVTGGVEDSGRIVISSYPQRAKTKNARKRPQVSVLVLSDEWDDAWVQIDGDAEVIDAVDDVEPFVEYFRNIAGEHSDWDEYRAAMVKQNKSLIRVTPTRWGPVATGGFPPDQP